MKVILLALGALMLTITAHGQGYFIFNSRNPTIGNDIRFLAPDGSRVFADYVFVQVFAGPSPNELQPLSPALAVGRTVGEAGYTYPLSQVYRVPGMESGNAFVGYQARAIFQGESWDTALQKTLFITTLDGGLSPTSLTVALATRPDLANDVLLGIGSVHFPIPEPATWALCLIGLGTALLPFRPRSAEPVPENCLRTVA
jgi:hypothetical protein